VTAAAESWMQAAPPKLAALIRNLTWHRRVDWNVPDYIDDVETVDEETEETIPGDGRRVTSDLEQVEAFSSLLKPDIWDSEHEVKDHALLLDIDVPAWLIPSSTEGHGHLYAQLRCSSDALWRFLEAAVEVGLVEEGYLGACRSRGMTTLRAPWIVKGDEPSTRSRRAAQAVADARLKAEQPITPHSWKGPVF
jgi:hypothetical protein